MISRGIEVNEFTQICFISKAKFGKIWQQAVTMDICAGKLY